MLLHKVISMRFLYGCSKSLYPFNDAVCFTTEIVIDRHEQYVTFKCFSNCAFLLWYAKI